MDVSCFLRNNKSLLIDSTDETTYKNVKDICEQRRCTYDFVINKFKLSDSPELDTLFTGCNFTQLVGVYNHGNSNSYFFFIEYNSLKNEKTIHLFDIVGDSNLGRKNIDALLSSYNTVDEEYIGIGSYGIKKLTSNDSLTEIKMEEFIPSGSSHLVFTSLSKGARKRETIKVLYYYKNQVVTSDTSSFKDILTKKKSLKILRTTPHNKQVTPNYLEEEQESIVSAIGIYSSVNFKSKIDALSIGGREYITFRNKTYSIKISHNYITSGSSAGVGSCDVINQGEIVSHLIEKPPEKGGDIIEKYFKGSERILLPLVGVILCCILIASFKAIDKSVTNSIKDAIRKRNAFESSMYTKVKSGLANKANDYLTAKVISYILGGVLITVFIINLIDEEVKKSNKRKHEDKYKDCLSKAGKNQEEKNICDTNYCKAACEEVTEKYRSVDECKLRCMSGKDGFITKSSDNTTTFNIHEEVLRKKRDEMGDKARSKLQNKSDELAKKKDKKMEEEKAKVAKKYDNVSEEDKAKIAKGYDNLSEEEKAKLDKQDVDKQDLDKQDVDKQDVDKQDVDKQDVNTSKYNR